MQYKSGEKANTDAHLLVGEAATVFQVTSFRRTQPYAEPAMKVSPLSCKTPLLCSTLLGWPGVCKVFCLCLGPSKFCNRTAEGDFKDGGRNSLSVSLFFSVSPQRWPWCDSSSWFWSPLFGTLRTSLGACSQNINSSCVMLLLRGLSPSSVGLSERGCDNLSLFSG